MSQPEYLEYDLNEIELEEEAAQSQAVPDPPQTPISYEENHVSNRPQVAEDEITNAESRKQRNKARESPSSTVSDHQDAYGIPNYDPKRIKTENQASSSEPPREAESSVRANVKESSTPAVSSSPPPPESVTQLCTWLRKFSVIYFSFANHPNVTSAIVAWSMYPKKISSDPDRYVWIHPVILHDSQRVTLEYGIPTATKVLGLMCVKVVTSAGGVALLPYDTWLPLESRVGETPFDESKFLRPAEITLPQRPSSSPAAATATPQASTTPGGLTFGAYSRSIDAAPKPPALIPGTGAPISNPKPPLQNIVFRSVSSAPSSTIPQSLVQSHRPLPSTPTTPGADRPATPITIRSTGSTDDKEVQIQAEIPANIRLFTKVDANKFFYMPTQNVMSLIGQIARSPPSVILPAQTFLTTNRSMEAFLVSLLECRCGQGSDVSHTYRDVVTKLKAVEKRLEAWSAIDFRTYISPWSGDRIAEVHKSIACPHHLSTGQNPMTLLPSSRWIDQLRFFVPKMVAYRGELAAMLRSRIHLTEWMVLYQTILQRTIDYLNSFPDAAHTRLWYIEEANIAARICDACQIIYTPTTVSLIMEHQIFITIQILCSKKQARDAVWLWRLWLFECECRNRSKSVCPVCNALFVEENSGCSVCGVRCVPNVSDGIDSTARAKALTNFLDHNFLTDLFAEMGAYDRPRPGPPITQWLVQPPGVAAARPRPIRKI